MRGKKIDVDFVTQFVQDCVKQGKTSMLDISTSAKEKIINIDDQLRRIEDLKVERAKLNDVISKFSCKNIVTTLNYVKNDLLNDKFSIQILNEIFNNKTLNIKQIINRFGESNKQKIFFSIKSFIESGILIRDSEKQFSTGPEFHKDMLDDS